ncbi:MAG: dihydroorotate dehydrogenase 1B [Methanoregulaceae archaeon PtaB.Bin056]|jgi:dihydroorotate dehydrogenase (NAD+) catalytic subunit|nr:MAG: dihydroorotate dehydrogenase 1B [Methanoregulaceae archaeon PtaB.Bin056]
MLRLVPGPVRVGDIALGNHLVLAAGILGTTGYSLARVLSEGAGGVVTKSIGPVPLEGHPGPCLVQVSGGLLNAMGLPNPSMEFLDELGPLAGKPVVVSIFGGSAAEFADVAGWFAGKVSGFELNLSCPHAQGYGAALGSDPVLVEECTRAVAASGVPTWVKLTPNVTDIAEIGRAAERGGASALVAINTLKAMRVSVGLRRPVLGNRTGGLSGKAIFPVAVRCVYDLYEACSIPIIGCGGISSAEDVLEMMMAGASAVQIGTAVMEDISIFRRIAEELYDRRGEPADSIVGCAHD